MLFELEGRIGQTLVRWKGKTLRCILSRVRGDTIANHHEACPAQRLRALGASCHRATKQAAASPGMESQSGRDNNRNVTMVYVD